MDRGERRTRVLPVIADEESHRVGPREQSAGQSSLRATAPQTSQVADASLGTHARIDGTGSEVEHSNALLRIDDQITDVEVDVIDPRVVHRSHDLARARQYFAADAPRPGVAKEPFAIPSTFHDSRQVVDPNEWDPQPDAPGTQRQEFDRWDQAIEEALGDRDLTLDATAWREPSEPAPEQAAANQRLRNHSDSRAAQRADLDPSPPTADPFLDWTELRPGIGDGRRSRTIGERRSDVASHEPSRASIATVEEVNCVGPRLHHARS